MVQVYYYVRIIFLINQLSLLKLLSQVNYCYHYSIFIITIIINYYCCFVATVLLLLAYKGLS